MSKIDQYINNLTLSDLTKKTYSIVLKKLERITGKTIEENLDNEEEFMKFINSLNKNTTYNKALALSTIEKYNKIVYSYIKFNKIKTEKNIFKTLFEKIMKDTSLLANPLKNEQKTREYYQDLFKTVDFGKDNNSKLLLSLNLFHPCLRGDLADVKIAKSDNSPFLSKGVIIFNKIRKKNKIENPIKIVLSDNEIKLVDFTNEYLINIKSINRQNGFSKLIRKISMKYLNVDLSQNQFRKLDATQMVNNINPKIFEQMFELEKLAALQGHNLNSVKKYYYNR